MFLRNSQMYAIKRFLYQNKGIVVPFGKQGMHPTLRMKNCVVHKGLRTLSSKAYLEKHAAWQHAWFLVTTEGYARLRDEVGLSDATVQQENQLETKA
ncbi:hypothetical protein ECANGB1_1303 [Enterospora canceri]|uniref:Plectin/eS10 N-terminal domain-containing protein n=1 Tax=Enterospora canceri TaxID=1081671 RepID=A0A1Y1S6C1_9MICR|nr:hypothetical protein ECANGB1_1303 [Enterospora canceri]